jgi:hypothetical protein
MTGFAALDVSKKCTSIYIADAKGIRLWRGRTLMEPGARAAPH